MSRQELINEYNQTSQAVKIYKASAVKLGVQYALLVERLRALDAQIIAIDSKAFYPSIKTITKEVKK